MKLIVFFTLVSVLRFLNGSVQSKIYIKRGVSTLFLPNGMSYEAFRTSNIGFTTSSAPYWTNYDSPFHVSCTQSLTEEIIKEFRVSIVKFITMVFKKVTALSEGHFVFSPYTAWLTLAALAEGTDEPTRKALLNILNLPDDKCLRQVFYRLGTSREPPSNDVILARNRLFIADSSLLVNKNWENFARSIHLNTASIPFKTNPIGELERLKRIFKAQLPNLNLNGNSFLLESLDYHGLWSSAFSEALTEKGPFYNTLGEEIGTMEYMKSFKRVNIAYVKSSNMKMIEIPIGKDECYKMILAIPLGKENYARSLGGIQDNLLFETLDKLRPVPMPIEIVIPRLTMTSEIDMRRVLEGVGIESLWTDPTVTRNISEPAALPSGFVQRVTVTLDNAGVHPSIPEYYNFVPPVQSDATEDLNSEIFKNFIANRPFMFGIFDSETYTLLFAATFSKPNV